MEAGHPVSTQLPINHVVLFSSGVGYFHRDGEVEGDARIDLTFPDQDINDLIKSMVAARLSEGPRLGRQLRQPGADRPDPAAASPST